LRSIHRRIVRIHFQEGCHPVGRGDFRPFRPRAVRQVRRVKENAPEDDRDRGRRNLGRQERPDHRPDGRSDLQEHPDPEVRVSLLYVDRGGPGRGGDDRDEGRADGIPDVDPEPQGQERHDDDAAPQPRQGTEKSRCHAPQPNQEGEFQGIHEPPRNPSFICLGNISPSRGFPGRCDFPTKAGTFSGEERSERGNSTGGRDGFRERSMPLINLWNVYAHVGPSAPFRQRNPTMKISRPPFSKNL